MKICAEKNGMYRHRGTAMVMMVLVSVVLTGLVLTIAWGAGVQAQVAGASIHLDQANLAAENAGQWAAWKFKQDNTWRQTSAPGTLPTMTVGGCSYSYAVTCTDAGATATLYWPFTEGSGSTTTDASGNGNTGLLVGGVTWGTGKYGNCLNFDGSTGYVDAGNRASTNIVGSVTMASWVKMNASDQDQKVGGNQDGNSGGYKMSIYGLKAEFEVRDASNTPWLNRSVGGGTILTMGVWTHVTGVYNASTNTIRTYINGILDRELTGVPANSLGSTTGDFIMGREPWVNGGSTRYFNGSIDDVRVYNRALSDQEIKTLANTSVHVHAVTTLQGNIAIPAMGAVDFICSAPTPMPPIAPALTVGGSLPMKYLTVSGDVQVTGGVTGVATSSVNGHLTYGTTYSDPHPYITVTYNGKTTSATQNAAATVPTINYANMQSKAISTVNTSGSGTGQTFTFGYLANQTNLIYVNGNLQDPVIDTSQSAGTLLVSGNVTFTKNTTYGLAGFPAYIVCEGNVSQTAGTLNLTGALYVKGNWTHTNSTINGDVCVGGNVTDNSTSASTIVAGGIPWFDPRANAATIPQPMYYVSYQGVAP